ncbi:MAG: fasciclin domain-containing protein [Verrucomicrobiales bacterium]|nr:fasciclin domain-containing protein [Verrucomicrobiales bacterium]
MEAVPIYQMVGAKVMAADVAAGEVAAVNGAKATITTEGRGNIEGANVVKTDLIEASKGVIHVTGTVIMPK